MSTSPIPTVPHNPELDIMATPGRLSGKVAIVTGGGSGFGLAISEVFAREGAKLVIGDLNTAGANSIAQKHPDNVVLQTMDVTKRENWDAAVKLALDRFGGGIDVLVNNAGTSYKNKSTLEVTEAEFSRCFDVNVRGIFHSVAAVFPTFVEKGKGASVINISSCGADRPRQGLVWYNASKGAVSNATKGLALEFGPQKIRVNSICPLLCGTGLFEMFTGVPDTPENRQKFLFNVPLGRLTETTDVANTALFLASDESSFITGVNLEVDGGRTI